MFQLVEASRGDSGSLAAATSPTRTSRPCRTQRSSLGPESTPINQHDSNQLTRRDPSVRAFQTLESERLPFSVIKKADNI